MWITRLASNRGKPIRLNISFYALSVTVTFYALPLKYLGYRRDGLWLFGVCGWTEIGLKTRLKIWDLDLDWVCKLLCCSPLLFVDLFIEPRLETLIKKCFGPEQIFKLQSSNNFMKKEIKLSSREEENTGGKDGMFQIICWKCSTNDPSWCH